MTKNTMVKWIFRIVFFAISIYHVIAYLQYGGVMESDEPIEYAYISKEIKKGGRGKWYQMEVLYNERKFAVNITSDIYKGIEENELPQLYYSSQQDTVFSLWERKRALRIALLFMAGVLITFLPFHKFLKK